MKRAEILKLLEAILKRQGKAVGFGEEARLQEIGFRSLDFSELALRVEVATGVKMMFDAAPIRAIRSVRDVLDFFEHACARK